MPQFSPSETKTAIATMTNPTGKELSYVAELYLGVAKTTTSGQVSFTIPAHSSKNVRFPIVMPDIEGAYPVYLDVFSEGQLISAFKADEDIVITVPMPSIDIIGFKYAYRRDGYYGWAGLTNVIIYPETVDYIGFDVRNNEGLDVSGVTVAFRVTNGGEKDISSPVYQFPPPGSDVVMTPPFTIPAIRNWSWSFYFRFDPVEPNDYLVEAEVYVNGKLVASASLNVYPDWPEPPVDGKIT